MCVLGGINTVNVHRSVTYKSSIPKLFNLVNDCFNELVFKAGIRHLVFCIVFMHNVPVKQTYNQ